MKRIFSIFFSLAFLVLPIYAFAHEHKITICHIPPGNPENAHSIEIDEEAWPAHEAHGDTMGECPADINHDPMISGPSYVEGVEGSLIEFTVTASDPDGDSITIETELPDGATYSDGTGLFQWVPSEAGSYIAKFTVCDSRGDSATLEIVINVTPHPAENHLPMIIGPETATTTVDTLLEFTVTASDPDGDPLTITSNLPTGAGYNATSGLFSWTPTATGTSTAIFFAFDGTGTTTHDVIIEVFPEDEDDDGGNGGGENHLPIFTGTETATSTVGVTLEFTVTASDPDGDTLVITSDLQQGATYNSTTGLFHWVPIDSATSTAMFSAFDGTGTSTRSVVIEVSELAGNDLPIIIGPETATTTVDTLLEFTVMASDPDGDLLTITSNLPTGAGYNATSGLFSWTPTATGTSTATFFAFDGTGTTTHDVIIEVFPEDEDDDGGGGSQNSPPTFVDFNPPIIATSTEAYSYDVNPTDPDNDILAFSLVTNPTGMSIHATTGIISWAPTDAQATSTPHLVTVQVSDGQHATTTSYSILVSLAENDDDGSGDGDNTPPPTPSGRGGGGGGGGGGYGANGPPWPLQPPIPVTLVVATTSPPPTPSSASTEQVPSQQTPPKKKPALQPQTLPSARLPFKTETSIGSISISTTTLGAEASAPAGGRSFALLLFAGLFNLLDWVKANYCILGWLLWLLTLIAFLLYIFATRRKEEKKPEVIPTANLAGDIFDEEPSPDDINQYWETYPQEKG